MYSPVLVFAYNMVTMLKMQMEGKINSWAIRWCYKL